LGLGLVCGVIPQNGGSIAAKSMPGRGTPCRVYLPQAEEVREQRGEPYTQGSIGDQRADLVTLQLLAALEKAEFDEKRHPDDVGL